MVDAGFLLPSFRAALVSILMGCLGVENASNLWRCDDYSIGCGFLESFGSVTLYMLRNLVNLISRRLVIGSGLVLGVGFCLATSRLPDLKNLSIGYVAHMHC